ncbi:unknown [Anaerotruncus sp. CAG:390]|nr:unknown [Anaerotruncus sp. CAG:390]
MPAALAGNELYIVGCDLCSAVGKYVVRHLVDLGGKREHAFSAAGGREVAERGRYGHARGGVVAVYPFAQARAAHRVEPDGHQHLGKLFQQRRRALGRAGVNAARGDGQHKQVVFKQPVVGKQIEQVVHLSLLQVVKRYDSRDRLAGGEHRRRHECGAQRGCRIPRAVYRHAVEELKALVRAEDLPHCFRGMRLEVILVPEKQIFAGRGSLHQPAKIRIGYRCVRHQSLPPSSLPSSGFSFFCFSAFFFSARRRSGAVIFVNRLSAA